MYNRTPGDLRDLRKRSNKEKKISVNESPRLKKMKIWVTWFIVFAFIMTSGIVIAGLRSSRQNSAGNPGQNQPVDGSGNEKQRIDSNIKHWQGQIRENPDVSKNYFNLAYSYLEAGKIEDADVNFKKFLELEPEDAHNYFNIGEAYLKTKELEKAREYIEKALEKDPDVSLYTQYLAQSYMMEEKYDKALEVLEKGMEKNPKESMFFALAGNIYMIQEKNEKSYKALKKAVELDQGNVMLYKFLALSQVKLGKIDDAKKTLEDGLEVARIMKDQRNATDLATMLQQLNQPSTPAVTGEPADNKNTPVDSGKVRDEKTDESGEKASGSSGSKEETKPEDKETTSGDKPETPEKSPPTAEKGDTPKADLTP